MVRVISGSARGRKLKTINSENTKPTLDRVKEAMFSMLLPYFPCRCALDMFSGNGSLGIEAISRGAVQCVFNDKSRDCCKIIDGNIRAVGFGDRSQVYTYDYKELIAVMKRKNMCFDMVFLDPPYGRGLIGEAMNAISAAGIYTCVNSSHGGTERSGEGAVDYKTINCIAVAEHSVNDVLGDRYGVFTKIKTRKYGTVSVSLYAAEA